MSPPRTLKTRLADPSILVLPGAADALTARVIEQAGFEAVYATGAGFSNGSFGLPDVGLISLAEVVTHVQRITDAVEIPVVADADTGYGGPLNVYRTVRQLESAGVAAIQIEDQATPKRCGHFDGKTVLSTGEMVQKLAAATDARRDEDLVLIARTDAYQDEGLDGAVARAHAYVAAGADVVFVEAPETLDDLEMIPKLVDAPLVANMVEGAKTPLVDAGRLEEYGYRVALFANTALRASAFAVRAAMRTLHERGTTDSLLDSILTWDDRQTLVGLARLQELEKRFLGTGVPTAEEKETDDRPGPSAG